MREWKFIGFDLGAESSRCIAAVLNGNGLILDEILRFPTYNIQTGSGFHWDVLAIFNSILEGITKAVNKYSSSFDGISIDTWGVDYVLIDNEGRVLGYPYHYRDNRTDKIVDEAFEVIDRYSLYNKTGVQAAQYNTLFQMLAEEKQQLSLLSLADKALLMPDYFIYSLTGNKLAEYTISSTTNLTDPIKRDWAWKTIEAFKLPSKIFPPIAEPGTKAGNVLPYISNKTGLNPDTPVFLSASHDTASAFAAVPASPEEGIYLSSGTWSLLGVQIEHPVLSEEAMNNAFTNEGGINLSTCFIKNIIGLWPLQECRRHWLSEWKEYSYPELVQLAIDYGSANAWINLDDIRFLKAGNMPGKVINFLKETGQKAEDNPGFITRVILESLAFSYRDTVKNLEDITGKKYNTLNAVGGGILNELLTQFIADATGLTVFAGPVEGAIIGNIGMQAIASGAVKNIDEWHAVIKKSFTVKKFEPVNNSYFEEYEKSYKRIANNKIK